MQQQQQQQQQLSPPPPPQLLPSSPPSMVPMSPLYSSLPRDKRTLVQEDIFQWLQFSGKDEQQRLSKAMMPVSLTGIAVGILTGATVNQTLKRFKPSIPLGFFLPTYLAFATSSVLYTYLSPQKNKIYDQLATENTPLGHRLRQAIFHVNNGTLQPMKRGFLGRPIPEQPQNLDTNTQFYNTNPPIMNPPIMNPPIMNMQPMQPMAPQQQSMPMAPQPTAGTVPAGVPAPGGGYMAAQGYGEGYYGYNPLRYEPVSPKSAQHSSVFGPPGPRTTWEEIRARNAAQRQYEMEQQQQYMQQYNPQQQQATVMMPQHVQQQQYNPQQQPIVHEQQSIGPGQQQVVHEQQQQVVPEQQQAGVSVVEPELVGSEEQQSEVAGQ